MWLDERTLLLGLGLRTNLEGARQVAATVADLGAACLVTAQPAGTMQLKVLDHIVIGDGESVAFAERGWL